MRKLSRRAALRGFGASVALPFLDAMLPAAKIIGRRELIAVHDGSLTMEAATDLAVTATRQFAKRQETWFRNRMGDWPRVAAQDFGNIVPEIAAALAD